ncbi:hypothetical protein T492DRAFT_855229 [Pavlovales sp. CCMP2436]|nr:hypothetical protein T492DRAFT_855229 [Pavlovales sp. CCMP2436]
MARSGSHPGRPGRNLPNNLPADDGFGSRYSGRAQLSERLLSRRSALRHFHSEGEESDDPDELPKRYTVSGVQYAFKEFESSNNNERVLCPICLKKFNGRKLRAADVETILKYRCNRMKRRDEWLVKWENYPTSKNT